MKDVELKQRPRVSVSFSRKVNLGNYESADIFVSLADDDMIDVEKTLNRCENIVNKKVKELIGEEKGNEAD